MKRIVACPKCEAKLSVFDTGKPINQKCPKCGHAFVISAEGAKSAEEAAAEAPKPAAKGDATDKTAAVGKDDKTAAVGKDDKAVESKAEKSAEAKASATKSAEAKAPAKKSDGASALDDFDAAAEVPVGGVTFMFKAAVIGLLLLIAIMLVISKRTADKQYGKIMEHFQYIETNIIK